MAERMAFRISSCLLLALVICSASIGLASAAAINPAPQDIPASCTVDPRWAAPGVSIADCLATVDKLYDIEVKPRTKSWERDDFEFLSPKMPGTSGLESRSTPRKYTVGEFALFNNISRDLKLTNGGTCTLAIVMLRFFQDKNVFLPVKEEGFCAYRDVTSFYELWEAGDRIRKGCLLGSNMPGMATEGKTSPYREHLLIPRVTVGECLGI